MLVLILIALGAPSRTEALGRRRATAGVSREISSSTIDRRDGRQQLVVRGLRLHRFTRPLLRARRARLTPAPTRARIGSTLGVLHRRLRGQPDPTPGQSGAGKPTLRQRCTERLQRLGHCVIDGAQAVKSGLLRLPAGGSALRMGSRSVVPARSIVPVC